MSTQRNLRRRNKVNSVNIEKAWHLQHTISDAMVVQRSTKTATRKRVSQDEEAEDEDVEDEEDGDDEGKEGSMDEDEVKQQDDSDDPDPDNLFDEVRLSHVGST